MPGLFETLTWRDLANLVAFLAVIAGLVGLMAVWNLAPMFAALYIFVTIGAALFIAATSSIFSERKTVRIRATGP